MIQITPQMRLLVAVAPADFRRGIDGLARVCREALGADPFSGTLFVFRNRRGTAIKLLAYDGQGFWLCQKRLSKGKFRYWPGAADGAQRELLAHELQVLLAGGHPERTLAAPQWRRLPLAVPA
jgi:transposase